MTNCWSERKQSFELAKVLSHIALSAILHRKGLRGESLEGRGRVARKHVIMHVLSHVTVNLAARPSGL